MRLLTCPLQVQESQRDSIVARNGFSRSKFPRGGRLAVRNMQAPYNSAVGQIEINTSCRVNPSTQED
jgi:hypothetical protein